MSKIKAGDLARTFGANKPENNDKFVEVISACKLGLIQYGGLVYRVDEPSWVCRSLGSPFVAVNEVSGYAQPVQERPVSERKLRKIDGQSGNESWFRAAPKSLPATTKGDTITNRGELA